MTTLTTRGQAACLVLGKSVTEANRVKCKAYFKDSPLDVVYTSERGKSRPFAIGKVVADRDPFTYHRYPGTPLSSHVDLLNLSETNDPSESDESSSSACKSTDSS